MTRKIVVLSLIILFAIIFVEAQEIDKKISRKEIIKQSRLLMKESIKLIDNNKYDSALIFLDSILSIDKKNPDAHYYKGFIFLEKGDSTTAMTVLSEGISKSPMSTRLKILSSKVLLNQGDYTEAGILLDKILAIKPKECEALYLRGVSLLEANDTVTAIEKFQKALGIAFPKGKK
ncbi:MAG: hypothetical protein DRP35_07185 [Candidatus Zixiibacteriota bacterium]|nr:MAG: hypothetical protein DRP35_07185 [candidate division Zixibacteria bacterium]